MGKIYLTTNITVLRAKLAKTLGIEQTSCSPAGAAVCLFVHSASCVEAPHKRLSFGKWSFFQRFCNQQIRVSASCRIKANIIVEQASIHLDPVDCAEAALVPAQNLHLASVQAVAFSIQNGSRAKQQAQL